jgi:hypothetical protein
MLKLRGILVGFPLAALFFWSTGWAQQPSTSLNSAGASSQNAQNGNMGAKQKHWNGTLIDMGCMTSKLGAEYIRYAAQDPTLGMPRLSGWGAAMAQEYMSQVGPPTGNMLGPGQQSPSPATAQQAGNPANMQRPDPATVAPLQEAYAGEQTTQSRLSSVNDAAKVCGASSASESVGVATGAGQVLKFDHDGMMKTKEALKSVDLASAKKVKAKVTGTLEDAATVRVASIDIKGVGTFALRIDASSEVAELTMDSPLSSGGAKSGNVSGQSPIRL